LFWANIVRDIITYFKHIFRNVSSAFPFALSLVIVCVFIIFCVVHIHCECKYAVRSLECHVYIHRDKLNVVDVASGSRTFKHLKVQIYIVSLVYFMTQ